MYKVDSKEVRCMKIRAYDYGLMGERVKQARKTKRYTQAQLAEIIDMSSKNFSQIERGETGISLSTLMSLCKALEVSADYILFGTQGGKNSIDLILTELNEEQQLYAEKMLEVYAEYCKKHK